MNYDPDYSAKVVLTRTMNLLIETILTVAHVGSQTIRMIRREACVQFMSYLGTLKFRCLIKKMYEYFTYFKINPILHGPNSINGGPQIELKNPIFLCFERLIKKN